MGTGRRGASRSWLVLAGGGLFVAVAALAAWQFSVRRDAAAIVQASPASAAASSTVAAVPSPPPPPIIIEAPEEPPSTLAKDATKAPVPMPVPPVTATADTGARGSTVDRAPSPDAGAASSARLRPPGKPVPRVGDDPSVAANNGLGTTRPPDSPTPGSPNSSPSADRHVAPGTPPSRDYGAPAQRPVPAIESSTQSIHDVCKGSFFERNICMDQRCEEARFHSTPECIEVLARKRKYMGQGQ
jgi:hypothetical protein